MNSVYCETFDKYKLILSLEIPNDIKYEMLQQLFKFVVVRYYNGNMILLYKVY